MDTLSEVRPSLSGPGTPESAWFAAGVMSRLPRWEAVPPASGRVVVVAPHPDDEVLGPGGTVARLVSRGAEHVAVAVTDGEASHPGRAVELRRTRPLESRAAAQILGIRPSATHRLALPDGKVEARSLARVLARLIRPGDLVLAPWVSDGHPDHAHVGLGADVACASSGGHLLAYLIWAWHWARPDQLPWHRAVRVDLGADLTRRKREAVRCFSTQVGGPSPILAPAVVERLTRPFEILLAP